MLLLLLALFDILFLIGGLVVISLIFGQTIHDNVILKNDVIFVLTVVTVFPQIVSALKQLGNYYLHTVVCIKVRHPSFPRFWKNHPQCRKNVTSYKRAVFFTQMKPKKFQNGRLKKFKMATSKKNSFFSSSNSQYFFMKFSWSGPWVSRID